MVHRRDGTHRAPPGLTLPGDLPHANRVPIAGRYREPDYLVGDEIVDWGWKETFTLKTEDTAHINIKELRAVKVYLRRRAKQGVQGAGSRVVLLIDSRVVVGAIAHGRSSSLPINRGLRQTLPLLIGSKIYPIVLWVPTGANPSDAPSRGKRVREWLSFARRDARSRRATRKLAKSGNQR